MFSDFPIDAELSSYPVSTRKSETLLFTGDFYLNHKFWSQNPFSRTLKEQIESAEYAVTNLEGAIDMGEPIIKHGPNLNITESTIESVTNCGFDAVSLANNHAMDFGVNGLTKTRNVVQEGGLKSFGAGPNIESAIDPVTTTSGEATVGIFGLSENQEATAGESTAGVAWAYEPNLGPRLKKRIEEYDVSVLVAHGGVEYIPIPPRSWRAFLRSCTNLGFDLILGHHPHTPQGWEWYQGTPIFYSLGNFAMYRPNLPSTQWSYILEADISERAISGLRVSLTTATKGQIKLVNPKTVPKKVCYLEESSEIISDDGLFEPHWQTVAERVYSNRNHRQLKQYGLDSIVRTLSDPFRKLDQLTRKIAGISTQNSQLALREYVQNPSHRDIIQTYLSLETSALADQRTDETTTTIDKLYEQSGRGENKRGIRKHMWRMKVVAKRLNRALQS
jgi:poly-gamma-glutamate synthesis protein (capsule biosynthesis protein)